MTQADKIDYEFKIYRKNVCVKCKNFTEGKCNLDLSIFMCKKGGKYESKSNKSISRIKSNR